jgi:fibronectin-binding autotransporter adhesin
MATYYWVGGSGTWDNSSTTNWATSTGGAGGFGPPITGDAVNFDSNSGTAATVTVASTAACTTCVINKADINLSLSGNVTFAGTTTLTAGTITLNNNTFTAAFFGSNNSNTRSIAFGTGQINLTGNGGTVWGLATATNFSYTGTPTVNFTYAGSTSSRTINHGGTAGGTEANAVNLNVTAGSDGFNFGNAGIVRNVNFTGFSGTLSNFFTYICGDLTLSAGMTLTAGANPFFFNATSGTQRITSNGKTLDFPINFEGVGGTCALQDNLTIGSTRAVALNNGTLDLTGNSGNWTLTAGSFNSQSATTRSVTFGTGKIVLTGNGATIFSTRNITNFSCTGSKRVELTYAGSTGTRIVRSGDLGGTATADNTVDIFIAAGSDTVDFFTNATTTAVRSLDTTGFSGTISANAFRLFGSLTLSAATVFTGTANAISFISTSAGNTITTNGATVDRALTFNGTGGIWEFQDALTQGSSRAFTITNGTVKLKSGVTSTVGAFATSGTNQKFLQSTLAGSQATLSQASGTVSASYLTIQDINATGGATWQAFTTNNSVDAGNNSGWDFSSQLGKYIYTRRKNKRILP